jgi:class 3 adenylate cyclase/tetratricopeptide (TPR) repeat protein
VAACKDATVKAWDGRAMVHLDSPPYRSKRRRMRCLTCDTELLAGKQFCHACGTRVAPPCVQCGNPIDPRFRFCPECGAPAAPEASPKAATTTGEIAADGAGHSPPVHDIPASLAAKIRASQGVIAGERKLVTVMFSDLVGSTSIAERLDPEDFRDLLDQYLAIVFREVYRVEGIITQLAGDGVMALFGAPVAHEDAPYRGVYAALAIRDALAELSTRLRLAGGVELRVRIGVHTGPVVVGTVGSDLKMDYTAIGDTTNLSQRLQTVAEPGMVLISEATERLVRGFFDVRPARRFERAEKQEALVACEVLGLSGVTTPMAIAEARGLTAFVGRQEELAQLVACFDRLAGSLAQVVTVVGDAGSGKSRLIHELKLRLADAPVVFFEARCSAMTHAAPYAPWVVMMRQYFGLGAADSEKQAWATITEKLGGAPDELVAAYPGLPHVLGLHTSRLDAANGDELKRQTFETVAQLVNRAGGQEPVVMIIEDIQWMDELSREMLALAVGKTSRSRLMIVTSHRADHQPTWRVKAAFTQLALRPLSDDETTDIVRAVAGGALPLDLERRLVRKADGNPFFTEEITRTLVEEGYLLRGDGQVRVTRPIEEIRMPGTVEELIGARLDRLAPQAKRVVQVAAVLGRQFQREQLVALLAGEELDVDAQLTELEARGVLHRANLVAAELRFGESLTQEVAYEGLLLRQRRALHARIGRMLDAAPGETTAERAALLAHHFARSDDRERAVSALLTAAREAERVPSFRAAAGFYRDAFETAEGLLHAGTGDGELPRRTLQAAYGLCRMAVIYGVTGLDEAERAGLRARELAEQLNDTDAFVDLCSLEGTLAMSNRVREKFTAGFAMVEKGLAVAQRDGLVVPTGRALRALATGYLYDGRFEDAERTIDAATAALARVDDPDRPSDLALGTYVLRARIAYHRDDTLGTLERTGATYDTAVQVSNRTLQTVSAATLAQVHLVRGEYEAAMHWVEKSLEVALAIGNINATGSAAAIGALAALETGDTGSHARYVELLEHGPIGSREPLGTAIVIEALLAAGSLPLAAQHAEAAYALAGGRLREAVAMLALGDVRLRQGAAHASEAHDWHDRTRRLANDLGVRSLAAGALLGLGESAVAQGDTATGIHLFEEALAIYRNLGLGHYAARGERLLAACRADLQRSA